jgi:hypothetical protein
MQSDSGTAQEGGDDGSTTMGCGAIPPSGTQIVAAPSQLVVQGLTTDGKYVFYVDTGKQTLSAVPVAGGQPAMVGPYTISGGITLRAGGAAYFSSASMTTNIGALQAWTPGTGGVQISNNVTLAGGFDMSPDGSLVAYFAAAGTDATTGTLTVSTADGKTQTPLVMNVDVANCPANAQFVQPSPSAPPVLLAAYCPKSAGDGGAPGTGQPETIAAYAGAAFTQTVIGTFNSMNVPYFMPVDPKGTQMLLAGQSGGLALYPIAGGAPKTVDANGVSGTAQFASDAGDIVYSTSGGAVNRYSATTGTTTALLATGNYALQTLSKDGTWMQLSQNVDPMTGGTDVFLASATTAGMATSLWPMLTASASGFTSDSKYEFFATAGAMAMTSDLYSSPVSGGAPSKLATIAGAVALPGSVIAIADNYTMSSGTADIEVVDMSNPTAKKTLVTQADPNLNVAATNQIVYSWYCQLNSMAGIWVAPPP